MAKHKSIQIPDKKTWSQRWTDKEAKQISEIAVVLRNEVCGKIDNRSLWRTAEGEFTTNTYTKDYKGGF